MSADDVTVVLLTLGEASADRARESVRRQTAAPAAVVEVRDVRPFHRALNEGVSRVRTPLLLQLDADMTLDARCVETLRAAMHADPAVGVAVAFLRDPLVGRVSGVKMFRRACFDAAPFRDSVSPDTDFLAEIRRAGWRDVYVLDFAGDDRGRWHTLGTHEPAYDARYTYAKYLLEGARHRHHRDASALRWHLGELRRSRHPQATLARVAMVHGILAGGDADLLGLPQADAGYASYEAFVAAGGEHPERAWGRGVWLSARPEALFRQHHVLGAALRRAGAFDAFARAWRDIEESGDRLHWIALAGLARGALGGGATIDEDLAVLRPLLPSPAEALRGKLGDAARRVRRFTTPRTSVRGTEEGLKED
ncbi:glycosyl transferase family 2 [Gemmatirosa kalamazoonensis]|uniref:Glycosyl transferase family 2 n=1 Tax=Gemmatirosa kalamazoonensis TaxID=861299 RepID=W0RC86_9BACT|nr:glycosyltransferase [Gemmatirosa kalamazoonensis]AHG88406.1 glycosyl transferase family 2 [Gemmatirosa kalamazoonensis]